MMTRLELDWFHSKLVETKNKESEAREKALAEIRNKQSSKSPNTNLRKRNNNRRPIVRRR